MGRKVISFFSQPNKARISCRLSFNDPNASSSLSKHHQSPGSGTIGITLKTTLPNPCGNGSTMLKGLCISHMLQLQLGTGQILKATCIPWEAWLGWFEVVTPRRTIGAPNYPYTMIQPFTGNMIFLPSNDLPWHFHSTVSHIEAPVCQTQMHLAVLSARLFMLFAHCD